ncbi:MAG: diguanylate cyclase response regulator [Deltaproteobacteria bacterium RIFOXYD12_FULL_57_12]|nr:MAG: diguanylate cyclase response regulator [Deltaproteobacteria bacterium RIFOXYD12_FULL_57_12]
MPEKINILIVDDRPVNLLVLEGLLDSPELNIIKAFSGNEALGLMLEHDFALVLLDVQMPEMDGFETAQLMRGRKETRHVPIIFITAISKEQKHIFKGYESGAVDYLFKPIEPEILKSKVAIFLELHRQKKLLKEQAMLLDFKVQELLETKHQLEQANSLLEKLSVLDGLTGIANRRRFDTFLDLEWRRALREGKPLSLIMADIDYFKDFNDLYGHQAGDECLRKVAATMSDALMRPTDLLARYGGEEFAAVLPETSDEGVYHIATLLKESVENLVIPHAASTNVDHVTISLGTCTIVPVKDTQPNILIETADQALYQAKQAGRNRIVSLSR